MKLIPYQPKMTNARTQYVELRDEHHAWLITELVRWLATMSESQNDPNELWQIIHAQYWSRPTKTLPKSRTGLNSPSSFVGGLVNNLMFGSQRDFSLTQLDAVRDISSQLSQLFDSVEPLQFRIDIL